MQPMYDPSQAEAKWQRLWEMKNTFRFDLQNAKDPYYCMVMFPYPSGARLHVGHWFQYSIPDSFARFMRMKGKDVFHPMGFDAFGLPAENYAIKTGTPPAVSTKENVDTMIEQFKRMGVMYDWTHSLNTSDPTYYRWTQWLFLQMFKHDLAYKKEANVNWCTSCQTVLANEQVKDGTCERCGSEVVQKNLSQWFWKITQYAERLLSGLDNLDWPEKTKTMQKNWIDRSEGANLHMKVKDMKRGLVGPMNWPMTNKTLAADLNRQLTNETKQRIHSPMRTVHLVFTPYSRESIFMDSTMAKAILQILDVVALRHDITIHEAVAMPDHVHLLVSFDAKRHLEQDIVKKLKGASAREFLKKHLYYESHLWGQKMHFEEVDSAEQFEKVILYIRENPVKQGITNENRLLSLLPISFDVYDSIPQTFKAQTFVVIAPEHPLVKTLVQGTKQEKKVLAFVEKIAKLKATEKYRFDEHVEGIDTGRVVQNPFGMGDLPIWVASFVVMDYGTGIVSCSAHDERDFIFAKKYGIPLRPVMFPSDPKEAKKVKNLEYCYTKDPEGVLEYPVEFKGRKWGEAREDIIEFIIQKRFGDRQINYRLRDWLVSRQRYWGAPIPIVYDPEGNPHPVPEEHLPWLLPTDVAFKPTGKSPLTDSKEFIERTERIFGKGWTPEFDTMDTFVCSSFYYLLYLSTESFGVQLGSSPAKRNNEITNQRENESPTAIPSDTTFIDPAVEKKWMPVDLYIGGPEHATMHLIYARFVMMALKDFGLVSQEEPFRTLVHQGLITNKGAKMSKSKGNVVSPDALVEKYGADVFRMYLMFMGPFTDGGDWSDTGIRGISRFVQRMWKVITEKSNKNIVQELPDVLVLLHKTIAKVSTEIEALRFNTAISAMMECLNALEKKDAFSLNTARTLTVLLAPLAPHLAEELWEQLGGEDFVVHQKWPSFDLNLIKEDTMTIVVQVNGKIRGEFCIAANTTKEEVLRMAKELPNVQKYMTGKLMKEIYVPSKLISLVLS